MVFLRTVASARLRTSASRTSSSACLASSPSPAPTPRGRPLRPRTRTRSSRRLCSSSRTSSKGRPQNSEFRVALLFFPASLGVGVELSPSCVVPVCWQIRTFSWELIQGVSSCVLVRAYKLKVSMHSLRPLYHVFNHRRPLPQL
jgi:hypothetical protein